MVRMLPVRRIRAGVLMNTRRTQSARFPPSRESSATRGYQECLSHATVNGAPKGGMLGSTSIEW